VLTYTVDALNAANGINPGTAPISSLQIDPTTDFAGWKVVGIQFSTENSNSGEGCLERLTLQAVSARDEYNISYYLNAGNENDATNSPDNPGTYLVGTGVPELKPATRPGYTFGGWYTDRDFTEQITSIPSNTYAEDLYLHAKWIPQHTITFDGNGATGGSMAPQVVTDGVPADLNANAFTKTGYNFAGWKISPDGEVAYADRGQITVDATVGDIVLHASWEIATYNITYMVDGERKNDTGNPSTYTYGEGVATLKPATKSDATFEGWYSDAAKTTAVTSISATQTGNVTLYAKFKENTTTKPEDNSSSKSDNNGSKSGNNVTKEDLDKWNANANKSESDMMNSTFGLLQARSVKYTKNSITLKWKKLKGADGYLIYGNQCNDKNHKYKYQYITTIKGASKTTWTAKKLKSDRYYKYYVAAYKNVGGEKQILCMSKTIDATTVSPKYGVAQKIKLNKKKTTLKVGKTFTIKAKEVNANRKISSHRAICYESSNTKVATVSKKGKIKAVGKGKCTIWIYAQNGMYTSFKVTVK